MPRRCRAATPAPPASGSASRASAAGRRYTTSTTSTNARTAFSSPPSSESRDERRGRVGDRVHHARRKATCACVVHRPGARLWRRRARWRPAAGRCRATLPCSPSETHVDRIVGRPARCARHPSSGRSARLVPALNDDVVETASASTRRPCTVTEYCICWPAGTGGTPTPPAGATTFCSCTTPAMSAAVTPRRAILSGSSQMRML